MEFTCGEWGRQEYGYDARGRLLSVSEGGQEVELYAYDAAGNVLRKTVRGRTTTFAYDGANQLVSSECGDARTEYAYDAAGRLVREGNRTYRYGYLDKVLQVSEGDKTFTYAYHPDGQLARADYGDGTAEDFLWDGLALVRRGGESILNEPHPGGGSPVLASSGTAYFSDILGTTLGEREKGRKYAAARQTAFGEGNAEYFTGKPAVAGLGRAFLFRNYRPDLARWQTADPLGYPDGWNSLAYCGNEVTGAVDLFGGHKVYDNVFGYTNRTGLGHWWKIIGECNEDPKALVISYKITDYPPNVPTAFDGPFVYNLKIPEKGIDIQISDPNARFSGFGYAIENEERTPRIGKEIGDISYYTLEFDFVMHYNVTLSYTYKDPETGETYSGSLTAPEYIREHVKMTCSHKIME